MNSYNIWCSLHAGTDASQFVADVIEYLDYLEKRTPMSSYRLQRRKLGLGSSDLGEFFISMEFAGLAELDETFEHVATRKDPVESLHHRVYSKIRDARFALYRDFPDDLSG